MTDTDDPPPRRRIPDLALAPLAGGEPVPLRARRQGTVLVLLGGAPDESAAGYLRRLAAAEPSLRGWDGRVLVVVDGEAAAARPALDALALPFPVLVDVKRAVAAAAGVAAPALVVADQWGDVHATHATPGDPWLDPREVEQWLQWMSIRCAG